MTVEQEYNYKGSDIRINAELNVMEDVSGNDLHIIKVFINNIQLGDEQNVTQGNFMGTCQILKSMAEKQVDLTTGELTPFESYLLKEGFTII